MLCTNVHRREITASEPELECTGVPCVPHLTCLPWIRDRRHRFTMFQEVLLSYRIRFSAMATWEWQLSQQMLC